MTHFKITKMRPGGRYPLLRFLLCSASPQQVSFLTDAFHFHLFFFPRPKLLVLGLDTAVTAQATSGFVLVPK